MELNIFHTQKFPDEKISQKSINEGSSWNKILKQIVSFIYLKMGWFSQFGRKSPKWINKY